MKNRQIRSVSTRLTPLRCTIGVLALVLACCSALCIYFYLTPAHASSSSQQAAGTTMSAQVPMDDTETPSQTPTSTATPVPSPSSTNTATPAPSPSSTWATTPVPTSTRPATVTPIPSSNATSKQTPISVNVATGGQQTPVASSVSTNRQSNQAGQGANSSGNAFPIAPLCIGLGSLILLGLLLKGWGMLLRPVQPLRSPNLPLAGSISASRERKRRRQDSFIGQRAFDLSSSSSGVLTRNELEQVMHQRRVANTVPPLQQQGGVANNTSNSRERTSVNFYGYPGVPQAGGFMVSDGSQPTVANVPVPPATPPVIGVRIPASNGPATDSLGLSDPSMQATVQSYIY